MTRRFPSLNALKAFEAAARNMSFSIAADELGVTQAAISRQIRLLEDDLGVKLFHRLTRAVELTQEGQILYPELRDAFEKIERATGKIWGNKGTGILTISVLPTFAVKWLMPRLSRFSEAYPDVEVHIVSSIREVDFDKDDIDLAIRVGTIGGQEDVEDRHSFAIEITRNWASVHAEPLFSDELVAVSSPKYLGEAGQVETPDQLRSFTLLHMATRPNAWNDYLSAIGWDYVDPAEGPSYGHFFMSLQAAVEGKGIALVPNILAREELQSGLVVRALPKRVASTAKYYLLGHDRNWKQEKIKKFRKWIVSEVQDN